MSQKVAIVLDCGATNVRAIAINTKGEIVAKEALPNQTQPDPNNDKHVIWDVDEIWGKFVKAAQAITDQLKGYEACAITTTTFGVDGAPVKKSGELVYPVISWACGRTAPIMENIDKYIAFDKLYSINGVHKFNFNTINKLIWYKENRPDVLEEMDNYAFISSIFLNRLSGQWVSERSMAGTSMLTDFKTQEFSEEILSKIGYSENPFPNMADSGDVVGKLTSKAAKELNLPEGIPVIATGHDTQYAIFGSGAEANQPVLSSGTWEILMNRSTQIEPNEEAKNANVTNEFDSVKGLYNPGLQWLGSGVLEWIIKHFYNTADYADKDQMYAAIIDEATQVTENSVKVNIDFINTNGAIEGLSINTKAAQVYRASLEAMTDKTAQSLSLLEKNCNFKANSILCVGGGAKNKLWNQLRANKLGVPVKTIDNSETTVLGAALFAFAGAGVYSSAEEARNNVDYSTETYEPN